MRKHIFAYFMLHVSYFERRPATVFCRQLHTATTL